MRDLLPEVTAGRSPESPITSHKLIEAWLTEVTHARADDRQMINLSLREAETFLAPFKTNTHADNHWTLANPQKLRDATREFLENRHQIQDLMKPKEYKSHRSKDLRQNEAEFYTALNKSLHNTELTAVQREHVRHALKEMGVQTFARSPS